MQAARTHKHIKKKANTSSYHRCVPKHYQCVLVAIPYIHTHTTHTHTRTVGGSPGFAFHSADDIFKQFFGDGGDPFAGFFEEDFGMFGGRQGSSGSSNGGFFGGFGSGFGSGFGDFGGGGSSFAS